MIWMICTAARGGMRSVVEGYQRDGFFDKHNIRLLFTHNEGGLGKRLLIAFNALSIFVMALVRGRVELAHIHMAMRGSFWRKALFSSLAKAFSVPVILHLHGSEMQPFYYGQGRIGRVLIRRVLSNASLVFVLSRSWQDFVLQIAPESKVQILPNYVSVPSQVPDFDGAKDGGRPFTFLFMGILGKRKGIFDLLPAMRAVVEGCPQVRLRVGGNGDISAARAMAESLGLGAHVEFVGWVSGEAKQVLLADCDAFVLPSYNEGLPMAILEAMAYAKPVISTLVGGIPELIQIGKQGYLITPGDKEELARALLALCQDPERALMMGKAGFETVLSGYSEHVILPKISDAYARLLQPAS